MYKVTIDNIEVYVDGQTGAGRLMVLLEAIAFSIDMNKVSVYSPFSDMNTVYEIKDQYGEKELLIKLRY